MSPHTRLTIQRRFTTLGTHPFDTVRWERRDARITNERGETVFEQVGVEVPETWSQTATNIVVSKYFKGRVGTPERESSVRELIERVTSTIARWGKDGGYFATSEDAAAFEAELSYMLVHQMAAFNSPVWFNVGVSDHPQCSACFINSVEDHLQSILELGVTEGMLFKGGSGTGTNFSALRSHREGLAGTTSAASGPVAFMRGLDAFASAIKSGGKVRRSAKMAILNADHPDILEFIEAKEKEERKAWALIDAGYSGSMDGEAYGSVFFQNANHSVRATDAFFRAVEANEDWQTHEVTSGRPSISYPAKGLLQKMGEAAWICGDPGVQYDDTINRWHTCPNTDRIKASNPCSEYLFLDDSACNLASLNLMKFRVEQEEGLLFDVAGFVHTNEIVITAMEIMVGASSYPTEAIAQNSRDYRPLGIGFTNLGALLMSFGLPYDSEEGRSFAAALAALQTGAAYAQSTHLAEAMGPFAGFEKNRTPCLEVMKMHRAALEGVSPAPHTAVLLATARERWDEVVKRGEAFGLRNAQISVIAPTGTISFFMDCDTTGIEPEIALIKYKWLVGGGLMKIVNRTVPEALRVLGYPPEAIEEILLYVDTHDTIEGAPGVKEEHLPVFDCAFAPKNGTRFISYMGHLRMMAAVQPFVSGAISKTVNLPSEATPEDIVEVYMTGWKLGLKAISVYRDGSKRQQAITVDRTANATKEASIVPPVVIPEPVVIREEIVVIKEEVPVSAPPSTPHQPPTNTNPRRRRLPDERSAITHKFTVGTHKGYVTVGLYDDGSPGELFITMAKEGSVISGLMDSFAAAVSVGLQYGVPLHVLVNKFVHMRFEPSGYTNNPNIRIAKSIVDYIFRWMGMKFLPPDQQRAIGINLVDESPVDPVLQAAGLAPSSPGKEEVSVPPQPDLFAAVDTRPVEEVHTGQVTFASVSVSAPAPVDAYPSSSPTLTSTFDNQSDAPPCDTCGSIMVRNASCYKCLNCGATTGCS